MMAFDKGPVIATDSDEAATTNKDRAMAISSVAVYSDVMAA